MLAGAIARTSRPHNRIPQVFIVHLPRPPVAKGILSLFFRSNSLPWHRVHLLSPESVTHVQRKICYLCPRTRSPAGATVLFGLPHLIATAAGGTMDIVLWKRSHTMNDKSNQTEQSAHVLDNPVWHALTSHHTSLAIGDAFARRYPPEIARFGAVIGRTHKAFCSLAGLVETDETVALIAADPQDDRTWELVRNFSVLQMVYSGPDVAAEDAESTPENDVTMDRLVQEDVPEMLDLVALTQPGPFKRHTIELGLYLAVRAKGRIAAMAGQRMHLPGYREISAICTHPDFQRRGFARRLIRRLVREIQLSGDIPFLHVASENVGALSLFRSMGFMERAALPLSVLRRR